MRGILLFRGCVLRSPNSHGKNTTNPTKNTTRTATTKHYDWALLNNRDIRDRYVVELRNRFETFQKTEKGTPNEEYENFIYTHIEAAAKCIPIKPRTKYRVPWETLAVREKRAHVKTAPKSYWKNPTNTNARKLKTAQYQLAGTYIKEETEYIQNQIDKIRDSVEDRQSRIAWQTIDEVSRRKSTAKGKLKAVNQQERIKLWKQHFENLLGNPPKVTHEPITRIISKQLDIKIGPFTQGELDSILRKIKNRKAAGLDEIPPEVWKTRQFSDILLRHCNAVYNQNPIGRWMKGYIPHFSKKGDLGLAKNYRGITLTSIAVIIYNAQLRNRIEPKIDSILHVTAHKTEYLCYNHTGDISTLDGTSLKLVDKFTYLGSSVSSTEKDIDKRLTKAWTAIDRLSIIWKSDLTHKIKHSFF